MDSDGRICRKRNNKACNPYRSDQQREKRQNQAGGAAVTTPGYEPADQGGEAKKQPEGDRHEQQTEQAREQSANEGEDRAESG
ncbi:hypothetical protein [Paenibacillus sp. FJAT-26967]|uniref:hypothetical protein n=1 Tax=Paenibacillus sp. FJAT-26967 TaxID=1729690 RepID=UPI000838F03B|nr:hypothetical protein [Paenibacillus sp. FJAT-26967]